MQLTVGITATKKELRKLFRSAIRICQKVQNLIGPEFDSQVESIIKADHRHPIKAQLDIPVIQVKGILSFQLDYDINPVQLISESTFNKAANALNKDETVSLSRNQAAVIQPRFTEYTKSVFLKEKI